MTNTKARTSITRTETFGPTKPEDITFGILYDMHLGLWDSYIDQATIAWEVPRAWTERIVAPLEDANGKLFWWHLMAGGRFIGYPVKTWDGDCLKLSAELWAEEGVPPGYEVLE